MGGSWIAGARRRGTDGGAARPAAGVAQQHAASSSLMRIAAFEREEIRGVGEAVEIAVFWPS